MAYTYSYYAYGYSLINRLSGRNQRINIFYIPGILHTETHAYYILADPEGGTGDPGPPEKSQKILGFLAILVLIPEKSQSYQASI